MKTIKFLHTFLQGLFWVTNKIYHFLWMQTVLSTLRKRMPLARFNSTLIFTRTFHPIVFDHLAQSRSSCLVYVKSGDTLDTVPPSWLQSWNCTPSLRSRGAKKKFLEYWQSYSWMLAPCNAEPIKFVRPNRIMWSHPLCAGNHHDWVWIYANLYINVNLNSKHTRYGTLDILIAISVEFLTHSSCKIHLTYFNPCQESLSE